MDPGHGWLALRTETEWQGLLPRMLEQRGWDSARLLAETEGQGLFSRMIGTKKDEWIGL